MAHLTTAENVKKLHQAYQGSGMLNSKDVPQDPTLDPQIVFGMTEAQRV